MADGKDPASDRLAPAEGRGEKMCIAVDRSPQSRSSWPRTYVRACVRLSVLRLLSYCLPVLLSICVCLSIPFARLMDGLSAHGSLSIYVCFRDRGMSRQQQLQQLHAMVIPVFQVEMLATAKRHLETKAGFVVLGGFLSPSSDCYVKPKCQRNRTPHVGVRQVW